MTAKLSKELIFLLFLVVLAAGFNVWIRTTTVMQAYQYVQQEKLLRQLQADVQSERVRWIKLTSPEELEKLAVALKLTPPESNQLFRYEIAKGLEPIVTH